MVELYTTYRNKKHSHHQQEFRSLSSTNNETLIERNLSLAGTMELS